MNRVFQSFQNFYMYQKVWDILLVDDEPDVLSVSELAYAGF